VKAEVSHAWTKRISSSLEYAKNLEEGTRNTMPTGAALGISYLLTERVQLFLKQRILTSGHKKFKEAQFR
jgi:hypothetical protein